MPKNPRRVPKGINIPIASEINKDKSPIHTPNTINIIPFIKLSIVSILNNELYRRFTFYFPPA